MHPACCEPPRHGGARLDSAAMWELPDPRTFDSLVDLIEDAAVRYDGREQMALRTDEGCSSSGPQGTSATTPSSSRGG